MAGETAASLQRCGACSESFKLAPLRIPVKGHSSGATHAACCPFCGFLNRPNPAPRRAALRLVRPPELLARPVPAFAAAAAPVPAAVKKGVRIRGRKAYPKPKSAKKPSVFGGLLEPATA